MQKAEEKRTWIFLCQPPHEKSLSKLTPWTQCGLERPVCSRCKRSGLACVGFDLPPTFINATTTKTGLTVTRVDSQIPLRQSFNLAAYEQQYLGVFWDAYLPGRPALGDQLFSQHTTGSWVTVAREISPQDDAVRKALLAVCMILIGQRDEQQWMVHKSLELYTSALDDVRKSLGSPQTWGTDALLVASRALSAYEVALVAFSYRYSCLLLASSCVEWITRPDRMTLDRKTGSATIWGRPRSSQDAVRLIS